MDLSKMKIAIFTRSMNYSLYKISNNTLTLPFKHYRLTYTTAQGYLDKILEYDIDYAINIDEDAFVVDNLAILDLLEYCIKEEIVNCGIRDGGVLQIRYGNPLVTNPFFNIFNVKKIKENYSKSQVDDCLKKDIDYDNLLPNNLPYKYEISNNYEPFYPFFLWLNINHKVLYLEGKQHNDNYSTILYNHKGEQMLFHSWFSREYGVDQFHTNRINDLYRSCTNVVIHFSILEKAKIESEKLINQVLIPVVLPIRRIVKKMIK
ncbi:hypothetical protein SGQ44_08955 [Flavobacterium sp. Fl-77]|uniref:Uncharacterized protein n=1 Tax=Flavobacterium flavipigmentatum TaxID=2893884 RepID=A0AAJ2S7A6_9FLAO|nr:MULTISPECIES: hypothetical protein [unclassified Flavobacterium]MDX6182204.1 hypothetical protein [Flavobacterium sp. Fl-33]MDX6185883.1 hypothetical protein [Flavobacterium sp. Fl-77]UFH39061.1 hypothetical protein LNP22_02005 [Flavobacterium sp. F-70]